MSKTNPSQYANEYVPSTMGYETAYTSISRSSDFSEVLDDLKVQAQTINSIFGLEESFDTNWAYRAWLRLPVGAEKLFLVPRYEKIGNTYSESAQVTTEAYRRFLNGYLRTSFDEPFDEGNLNQYPKSKLALEKLGDEQAGEDLLVLPAQFGLLHRGRSSRSSNEIMPDYEFGLGIVPVLTMLMTHPGRLSSKNLWIKCPGDEYKKVSDSTFFTPSLAPNGGGVDFGAGVTDLGRIFANKSGSVSGFLIQ